MRRMVAMGVPAAAAAAVALGATLAAGEAGKKRPLLERFRSPATAARELPFSDAVRAGGLLFASGQVGLDPATGKLVPGGIGPETRQTMENLRRALELGGSSLDRVAKCTVFLADMAEWPEMNKVYTTYFTGGLPARSALGASGLALGARVEIECIATV